MYDVGLCHAGVVVLSAVKRMVKAVVPSPIINWGVEKAHAAMLALAPTVQFDTKRLGRALNLEAIFRSDMPSWTIDHAEISAAYGQGERYGGVNPGDRRAIYYLVRALKPARVLEIGTHVGASTLHIARALKANGSGVLTTVDIIDVNNDPAAWWRKVGLSASPLELARKLACAEHVTFVVDTAQSFMARAGQYDLIFLDGDHKSLAVYQEIAIALNLLSPGGRVLLHDYYPEGKPFMENGDFIAGPYLGAKRALRECRDIAVQPLGAMPWPTKQGSNMTSLALVVRAG